MLSNSNPPSFDPCARKGISARAGFQRAGSRSVRFSAGDCARRCDQCLELVILHRPRVEQHPAVVDPRQHRGLAGSQRARELCRAACPPRARRRGLRARAAAARRRRPSRSTGPRSRARRCPRQAAARVCEACLRPARASPAPGSPGGRAPGRDTGAGVASSAASESLSIRIARARGWRRAAATAAAVPTTSPACGPPSSLSPGAAHERRARRSASARSRAPRRAPGSPRRRPARPSRRRRSPADPSSHSYSIETSSTNPIARKFDWCTRRIAARSPARPAALARSRRAWCGWSSRPRSASLPTARPPPGSESRPRSRPAVRARRPPQRPGPASAATASSTAGGAVVDGDRRLGAGQLPQQPLDVGLPASALAALEVELEVGVAVRGRARPPRAPQRPAAPGPGWCGRSLRWR